jgi:CubicO group peptidase (beta-lactamase class C family)
MRRVLTILTALVLLFVSLGIGVITADLPFWRRALQLPLEGDAIYLPVATLGGTSPVSAWPGETMDAAATFDALTIEECANRARGMGSRALIVMHGGRLAMERYFVADDPRSLLPATVIARPLLAMAVGVALADGRLQSLDAPVSTWLSEWQGDARGRITLRQLLEETSGLETGGDIRGLLRRAPFDDTTELARFATARGVRMLLGNDYESSALGFRLDHEPGGFRHVSPANAQLAAVILERATGSPYEEFVDQRLWRAVGAGHAELPLDRRSGMPAAHCCWRATARDMVRVATLLATDGRVGEEQVLPAGWVAEMARPSRVSAGSGLQVSLLRFGAEEALEVTDDEGSAAWVVPSRQIVIVNIGAHGGGELRELPALLLRGLTQ